MNVNDSEKLSGLLTHRGWEATAEASDADVVLFNTCAVRERAEEKLHGALARLHGRAPGAARPLIAVAGCAAQLQGDNLARRSSSIDLIVGPRQVQRIPALLEEVLEAGARPDGGPVVALDSAADRASFDTPASVVAHSSPTRAYVTVMEGCNQVCSFCVVPRTRGPESYRPPDQVVDEVAHLVARGYREVMLLGQTVNAYRWAGRDFASLLEEIAGIGGLDRLRFTTSHPSHVSEALARVIAQGRPLCPYVHLPFQSGSNRILAAMRRGYTREEYLEKISLLRSHAPELSLSSDVIVGFPGETEDDFDRTLSLLDEVGFDSLFSFTYSPRPGTAAFRVNDDVPDDIKKRRLAAINERQQAAQVSRNRARVGAVEDVLIERRARDGSLEGRSRRFQIVHVDGGDDLIGRSVRVRIEAAGPNALRGCRWSD